jgi:hypothetical protein
MDGLYLLSYTASWGKNHTIFSLAGTKEAVFKFLIEFRHSLCSICQNSFGAPTYSNGFQPSSPDRTRDNVYSVASSSVSM